MKRTFLITSILIFLFVFLPKFPSAKEAALGFQLSMLLPPRNSSFNLTPSKEPEFYSNENLSSYKKDGADLYLENGFVGLISVGYYKGGEVITVEISKFLEPKGAFGIFTTTRIPKEGNLEVGDGSIQSKSSIIFWQDSYFVKLISLGLSEGVTKSMEDIAKFISGKIEVRSPDPDFVHFLPQKDLQPESFRYIMGPIGLKRYFSFYPDGVFDDQKNINEGAIATYKGTDEFYYVLFKYPNIFRANLVMQKIIEVLKKNAIPHYYLFGVLSYNADQVFYYKLDQVANYISIFKYRNKNFKYDWYLDRVKEKIK